MTFSIPAKSTPISVTTNAFLVITQIGCRAVLGLMKDMPLKKIRNFGGKLGAELQALGCNTAGEVLALPAATLHQNFGERATWILYTVQGNSDEQVQVGGWSL